MKRNNNVFQLENPTQTTTDMLTELARDGARQMLAMAMEEEVSNFITAHQEQRNGNSQSRFVRNGYLPERRIQTGIGDIPIKQPRIRDRASDSDDIKFISSIIPPYLRRSKTIDELLPLLYLRGISTGDFQSVLSPLFGEQAKNLSPNVISRLKSSWETEYDAWNKRDLSKKNYVYFWADGIYLKARMEQSKDCVLVIIGVTDKGNKELIAIEDGYRESKASWLYLLNDLKQRGLTLEPKLATGDGALGFWSALTEAYPQTRHQRCWCHKTINVLDKLPTSQQAQAKSALQDIWMAATKTDALKAFDLFVERYSLKYEKAVHCLNKDKDELLAFYDFPAEHWKSLRTTNVIESTFATVRHRTKKVKGCFSRTTILTMVFKLCHSAQDRWIRFAGFNKLADVISGVNFIDGVANNSNTKNGDHAVAA